MEKEFTTSRTIQKLSYNEETKILSITYTTGKTYEYKEVPKDVVMAAFQAESVGGYVAAKIRNGYAYKLVN